MTTRERWTVGLAVVVLLAAAGVRYSLLAERRPRTARQQFFDPKNFEPHQVVKPFPPIINPPHVSPDNAKGQLQPNELVLGVELDGVARAYPINMLTGPSREIFNDQLGAHAIAATW